MLIFRPWPTVCFHAESAVANVTEYISGSGADIFLISSQSELR